MRRPSDGSTSGSSPLARTRRGDQGLAAAAAYVARDSPFNAEMFVARVVAVAERLADHPMLGRRVAEVADDTYRELIFQNYRIVNSATEGRAGILGVIHSAMDMQSQVQQRGWDTT